MKAVRIHGYGGPDVIHVDEVPRPVPAAGEVLIRVAATSFNPSEVGLRRGLLRGVFPVELPYTLGWDVAGTVAGLGAGVRALAVGDRVVGRLDGGAAADFVPGVPAGLTVVPDSVPLAHAATLPVVGVTAWQAVFEHAMVTPGSRILVVGTGSVGGVAVQLAKHAGGYVIATAAPARREAVRELGADEVIPRTPVSRGEPVDSGLDDSAPGGSGLDDSGLDDSVFADAGFAGVGPVDAVLVCAAVGEREVAALAGLVRRGGVLVSATVEVARFASERVRAVRFVVRNDVADLARLVALVDAGVVRVEIAGSRALDELADVHRAAEAGMLPPGKTVLVTGHDVR